MRGVVRGCCSGSRGGIERAGRAAATGARTPNPGPTPASTVAAAGAALAAGARTATVVRAGAGAGAGAGASLGAAGTAAAGSEAAGEGAGVAEAPAEATPPDGLTERPWDLCLSFSSSEGSDGFECFDSRLSSPCPWWPPSRSACSVAAPWTRGGWAAETLVGPAAKKAPAKTAARMALTIGVFLKR